VRGCTRQEIAQEFVDFMLSDHVATLLAESRSHNIPLQKRVASQFPELQVEDPLQIDFYAAAALQEIAIKKLMESQFNAAQ
jgi:ABC-type Fe3+ transport system substrate-binding protein